MYANAPEMQAKKVQAIKEEFSKTLMVMLTPNNTKVTWCQVVTKYFTNTINPHIK